MTLASSDPSNGNARVLVDRPQDLDSAIHRNGPLDSAIRPSGPLDSAIRRNGSLGSAIHPNGSLGSASTHLNGQSDVVTDSPEPDATHPSPSLEQDDQAQHSVSESVSSIDATKVARVCLHQNGTVGDSPEIELKPSPRADEAPAPVLKSQPHLVDGATSSHEDTLVSITGAPAEADAESEAPAPLLKPEAHLVDSAEPDTAAVAKSSHEDTLVSVAGAPSEADEESEASAPDLKPEAHLVDSAEPDTAAVAKSSHEDTLVSIAGAPSEADEEVLKPQAHLVDSAEPDTAAIAKSSHEDALVSIAGAPSEADEEVLKPEAHLVDSAKSSHEDTLVSITGAPSEAESTSHDQQDPRISDGPLGPKDSQDTRSESQQAHPQGGPTNLEESMPRIEEEANAEPLPKADENQETIHVIADTCMSSLDQESEAEQSDTVPASGDRLEDIKELSEDPDDGDKPGELDESSPHGDTLSLAPNCLQTVAKPIEIDQAFQVSGGEDKHQHEYSSLTDDTVDEVGHSETEDAAGVSVHDVEIPREIETTAQAETAVVNEDGNSSITNDIVDGASHSETEYAGFSIQDVKKPPQIPGQIETGIEATAQDETTVVNEDEAVEPTADHVGAVSENPQVADSSPVSNESGQVMLSDDVSANDLGNSISTRSADTATIEFGSLSYQVACGHDISKVDIPDVECSNAQFAPSHSEIRPEVEAAISADNDCEDMTSNTALASKLEVSDSSIVAEEIVPNSIPEINGGEEEGDQLTVLNIQGDDKPVGKENEMVETPHSEESSASVVESSTSGSLAGQDVAVGPLISPFQYLIRVPRFDDSKVREQMKQAQLQIDEKTRIRDAFRHEIQKHQANCRGHTAECKAAVSDARSAKMAVRSKRAEIDSLQVVINQVKNAMSIDDIDARVCRMEYMMQHETLPLKEEKQFIREIKQLKQLRQQLSSSIGNKDEVQKAVNEREEIEGRLKVLKKELDQLKDGVIKSEAVVQAAQKKYDDENRKLREVGSKFQEANDARQSAFFYLQSLKKELYEKNKLFRMYKDTANAAIDFAASRDREALQHLCNNQVETIMEAWKDDEFRKEYVSSNMRSTVRRLGTLDGRSLGPDEEPPVLPNFVVERPARLIANQSNDSSVVHTPSPKLVEETKTVVSIDDSKTMQTGEAKKQTAKNRDVADHNLGDGPVTSSVKETKDEISEPEYRPTEEELELERKREEELAAKLREQRRVEEKSKALEALERKKRNAEKAQQRAELRAQKEAEQREKEREKRIRKKEKKKASGSEVAESDEASNPSSEVATETVKEAEWKRPQKTSVMSKGTKSKSSIPPPLRNRSKRKMQQWMWVTITCMLVIFLFVLGNVGFFSNLSNLRPRKNGPF